ncbi:putative phosphate transport system substrate-binding protein [Cylindrospermum sp. NIES-4074]|nr:putative phosphate transport system substrate-binding protein [Cylindrospermum sp. NIES-4074]
MWQQAKKDKTMPELGYAKVSMALWLVLATTPMAANLLVLAPTLALAATNAPTFELPQAVENGTTVRIDGSSSLAAINQELKANFEKQFSGTKVEVGVNGTDAAIKALLDGKIDVAAIPRGLTSAEKAKGLEQIRLRREKIAIVVGTENPYKGNLTSKQFAKIFRGEITQWSQLGANGGKIRFIDRPATSDTRNNFRSYPAFKTAKFATGPNAVQLAEDNTAEIVKQLGKDGISYVMANQVSKLQDVRVLQLNQTLPEDPQYPFSQPLVYVYKQNPTTAVSGFLGFTQSPSGEKAIEAARTAEASAIASSLLQKFTTTTQTALLTETIPTPAASPIENKPMVNAAPIETLPAVNNSSSEQPSVTPGNNNPIGEKNTPIWLLLPLLVVVLGGFFIGWFLKRRPLPDAEPDNLLESNDSQPPTEAISAATTEEVSITPPINNGNGNGNGTHTNGKSHRNEDTTSSVANIIDDLTPTTSATLAADASIWSDTKVTNTTTLSNTAEIISLDSGEVAWDIEAPVAVVNNSYPQLPNISDLTSDADISTDEVTDSLPELTETPEEDLNLELPTDDLLDEPKAELNLGLLTYQDADLGSKPLDVSAEEFNLDLPTDDLLLDEPTEEFNLQLATDSASDLLLDEPSEEFNLELATDSASDSLLDELEGFNLQLTTNSSSDLLVDASAEELDLELATYSGADFLLDESAEGLDLELTTNSDADLLLDAPAEELNLELTTNSDADLLLDAPAEGLDLELTTDADADLLLDAPAEELDLELTTDADADLLLDAPAEELDLELTTNSDADLLLDAPAEGLDLELTTNSDADLLLDAPAEELDLELTTNSDADLLLDEPAEELWNVVADEAELTLDEPEAASQVASTLEEDIFNLPEETTEEIALVTSTDAEIQETPELVVQEQINNTAATTNLLNTNVDNCIVLTPRTPKWAYVSWNVSDEQKEVLKQQGGTVLAVRLYDATDIDLSYQNPHLVQQYECEEATHDRYVAIPVGDRDYMAEIGYGVKGDRWIPIARSSTVRVFSRPRADFWFVTDTELIIHGATEPDAKVTIGGHPIKLKSDGTFHLRIPFSAKLIDYLMTASAANGDETKTIHKKYSQETTES